MRRLIGQELGGRYEIIARIGGGGMAVVYKGHDRLLNRRVAVKVLRQQFVHDEDFIRRFRREAQSAASLSHPNVVSIYDVGQEGDVHYIVMEYVEGSNLNDIIKERAPLQPEETVHIASQICDALDHAHQNGIIHRDIKPHNILIGINGRVKVTDFGIARAATSSDITQTGSVIGSVHYFSPEQAKGASQGEKSDLYSLGIVMYQMLTNRLPFLGDSPISVALKHLQEPVEDPRKINPLIPQSVENIVLKALQKRPENRYGSAREMLRDLESALSPERRDEPKIALANGMGDDDEPTRVMPAIRTSGRKTAEPASADAGPPGDDPLGSPRDDWDKVRERKMPGWVKPAVWMTLTVALLVGMWYGIQTIKAMLVVPVVEVPDVVGLTLEDAQKKLADVNLSSQVLRKEHHLEIPENRVISQDREPGSEVRDTVVIGLVVSLGPSKAVMPDLTGKPVDEAMSLLKELGLKDEQINEETVESEKEPGTVLQQSPAAAEEIIPEQARVTLVVSEGPGTVEMPDLIGRKESEAISILTSSGLKYKIRREPDYKMEKDRVFGQHPYEAGDQVKPGSEVTLLVSDGLPEDALQPVKMIRLEPVKEGKESVFQISINDAVGNRDWGNAIETDKAITVPVQVTVAPDKSANITVYRDGKWYNMWSVTYRDAMMLELGGNDEDAGGGADDSGANSAGNGASSDGDDGEEHGGAAEEAPGSQTHSSSDGGTA